MPAVLEVEMITPEPWGTITRAACLHPRKTPRSRTATVWSQASAGVSAMRPIDADDAGVVEHHVEPAELGHGVIDGAGDVVLRRHVGRR